MTPHPHHWTALSIALLLTGMTGSAVAQSSWGPCSNAVVNICFPSGNIGAGTLYPGERLHVGDGNILIEGGGETAVKIKRDVTFTGGPSGESRNPIFELGRIIQAGDGDPEFRFLYSDDVTAPRSVFEFDRKGIVASVRTDRGSHFEGFIGTTDQQPVFRLNSYPATRLEMGAGGSAMVDAAIERDAGGALSLYAGSAERLRIDDTGHVGIGTRTPHSRLDVSGDVSATSLKASEYVQLGTAAGMPPSSDCAGTSHVGRMKVDATAAYLYVCTARGWSALKLKIGFGPDGGDQIR